MSRLPRKPMFFDPNVPRFVPSTAPDRQSLRRSQQKRPKVPAVRSCTTPQPSKNAKSAGCQVMVRWRYKDQKKRGRQCNAPHHVWCHAGACASGYASFAFGQTPRPFKEPTPQQQCQRKGSSHARWFKGWHTFIRGSGAGPTAQKEKYREMGLKSLALK